MPYEVIDLDTDESHGVYDTLDEARGCVRFDRLRAYSIWRGRWEPADDNTGEEGGAAFFGLPNSKADFIAVDRVECCDPYDGDDDRAKQGLGEWSPDADRVDGYDRDDLGLSADY